MSGDHLFRIESLEGSRAAHAAEVERIDVELEVIRGPVPLAHKEPVDSGALGEVVVAIKSTRRFLRAAVVLLGTLILGGAGGTMVAIKTHYVEQGREEERARQRAERARLLEERVECLEERGACPRGRKFAPSVTPVLGPMP